MEAKLVLYLFNSILVMWAVDSVNITAIFKKNREIQAKVFYFIITLLLQLL